MKVNDPALSEMAAEEFKAFRTLKKSGPEDVRMDFSVLPLGPKSAGYPAVFEKYRKFPISVREPGVIINGYGRSLMNVKIDIKQRYIQCATAIHPDLFPDPAYHYCLTQPLSPWLKKKGLFFLHAGCVAEKGKGILIIGHSHAGKSTLTLSAVRAGFKFLSDEQPLLSLSGGRLRIHAFPRRIRLDRPAAKRFSELRPLLKQSQTKRIAFPLEQIWGNAGTSSCQPRVLIFPQFQMRGELRLRPMLPSAALAKLMQDDHFVWYPNDPWKKISLRHLELFQRLVNQAPAFSLNYGDQDMARIPDLFRRLLRNA